MGALLPALITKAVGWTAGVFYALERRGGPMPDGPVLITANHPNSLLDPLVVFRVAGRPARPMAKAPLFSQPIIGAVLRALGGLPVYRRQDDPTRMDQNEETFRAAIAALHNGDAVQIYPEGQSHSRPSLTPLKTGAARIALRAEVDADWQLGLRIVPVGLTYTRKPFFRGRAVAAIGDAITLSAWRDAYEADEDDAVRQLTAEVTRRLEALTLNLTRSEDFKLIETAERLYAHEKGWSSWRERSPLGERLPRLQAFARGLAWLRDHEPARHARLERGVRRYHRLTAFLGAGEIDVPPRYPAARVMRYVLRETFVLGLTLPLALAGAVAWCLPYLAPRPILRLVRPDADVVATWKMAISLFTFPLAYFAWLILAVLQLGVPAALLLAGALPPIGLVTLAWGERWKRVREDAKVFLRASLHRPHIDRLAGQRALLVAEFDAIAALLTQEGVPVTAA